MNTGPHTASRSRSRPPFCHKKCRACPARLKDLLLPEEQDLYFPKFNVDGLLRGDYQSRMQGYATGISNGFLSPNDCRRLENMDLIPEEKGGDDYYLNGGYVKLQDAGKQQITQAEPEKEPGPEKEEESEGDKDAGNKKSKGAKVR